METKVIFSEKDQQYLVVDVEGNVIDKSPTHEEAIWLADRHEATFGWCDCLSLVGLSHNGSARFCGFDSRQVHHF